ncbi:Triose-phosphate Transporter [Arthrobotrys musiformis]|uniref:Triose-phosphate Transporter n=1 Tax=Arthrobotrys musiformis TaxID=47236 RepID=A0AAV9W6Y7_9PEZI
MPELQEGENSVPLPPPLPPPPAVGPAVADTDIDTGGDSTTSIPSQPPHQHSSLSDGIQGESSGSSVSAAVVPASKGSSDANISIKLPVPPEPSAPASSSRSEMPTRPQPDPNTRRRSRGQSISTSFSPVGTNNSSPTGTPTDKISPTTRARSISQSISQQQSTSDHSGTTKEEELPKPKDSLELSTLSSGDSDEEAGLTESARDRRRKKKQRRRGLGGLSSDGNRMRDVHASSSPTNINNHHHHHATDEELAHGTIINGIAVTDAEKRAADQNVMKDLAVNGLLIGMWYLFSLCISVYNKWMFSEKHLNFRFPLFVTSFHMLVQFSLASLVMWYFVQFRPGYVDPKEKMKVERIRSSSSSSNASPTRGGRGEESRPLTTGDESDSDDDVEDTRVLANETQEPGPKKPIMTKLFYATRIAPCGMATGLDIGLGNMSLKYISLAFYTMCKSSSLAFVLIFAFIFRLEKPTVKLISVISVMTIGVIMMVADEAAFVLIGFILVMLASVLSGLRWSLTQLLLLRNPATSNPFSSIFFLAPVMFLSLLVIAIPVEGLGKFWARWTELAGEWGLLSGIGMLIAPGVVAFCMTASEFALLRRTSVVTLSICGIFKEVVTITASTTIFHDVLTPVNITGLFVTILSIGGYNYIKIKKMRGEAVRGVLATEADDAEGRRSLLFERRSLALNRASLESGRA